jgi:hypothetical protein
MTDPAGGRRLMALSLAVILALNVGLSLLGGSSSSPASQYGRPVLVALSCLLIWQGRAWARLLLALLSMGVLFAGPITLGSGLSPLSRAGAAGWLASVLCAAALALLYLAPSVRATFAAAPSGPSSQAGA